MEGCGSRKCHKESPPTSFNKIFWWLTTLMTLHQFTVINIRGTIPIYWLTSKDTVKISKKSHKYFLFFFIYSVSLSLANILLQIVHNKSPILCPALLVLLKLSNKYVKSKIPALVRIDGSCYCWYQNCLFTRGRCSWANG